MKERSGTVRANIQGSRGSAVVAASKRGSARGGPGCGCWGGDTAALARGGAVQARGRAWTAAARLEAVITTAAMAEAGKSAWCREHGVYPAELAKWCASATAALAEPEEARPAPQATR